MRSSRRGGRSDPVSSRPYHPGDDLRQIDRHASARLSAVLGRTELIVREHLAEEAAEVVAVVDDGPTMRLHPPPWLSKPAALERALGMIEASARRARSRFELRQGTDGLRPGSFVFVLSDFLEPPPERFWLDALDRRLDPIPVVLQDPVWERSFPDVARTALPIADPATGRVRPTRLSRREAQARRRRNEERFDALVSGLESLGLEPVVIASDDETAVLEAFLAWSELRRRAA